MVHSSFALEYGMLAQGLHQNCASRLGSLTLKAILRCITQDPNGTHFINHDVEKGVEKPRAVHLHTHF